jgi:hypothetical protein
LGRPVVPLEYSRTALSSGSTVGRRSWWPVSASAAKGAARQDPSAAPKANVSRTPAAAAASAALPWAKSTVVISHRAPEWVS